MTNLLYLHRAIECGDNIPHQASIIISRTLPESKTIKEAIVIFERQAEALADVLSMSLPGGTVDALLIELMKRKASRFFVPFDNSEKGQGQ